MTDEPERIWIDFEPRNWPSERIMYGDMPDPYLEYVRKDLSTYDAGFAAGIEAAVEKISARVDELKQQQEDDVASDTLDGYGSGLLDEAEGLLEEIRALAPSTPPSDDVE